MVEQELARVRVAARAVVAAGLDELTHVRVGVAVGAGATRHRAERSGFRLGSVTRRAVERDVEVGPSDGQVVVIESGLREGEEVALSWHDK